MRHQTLGKLLVVLGIALILITPGSLVLLVLQATGMNDRIAGYVFTGCIAATILIFYFAMNTRRRRP